MNKIFLNKKRQQNGFVLSIEAVISLTVLILVILTISIQNEVSLKELLINEQQNDLLRVWSSNTDLFVNNNELIKDCEKMFGKNLTLYVNEVKLIGETNYLVNKNNCISNEGIVIEKSTLLEKKIKIIVCE